MGAYIGEAGKLLIKRFVGSSVTPLLSKMRFHTGVELADEARDDWPIDDTRKRTSMNKWRLVTKTCYSKDEKDTYTRVSHYHY